MRKLSLNPLCDGWIFFHYGIRNSIDPVCVVGIGIFDQFVGANVVSFFRQKIASTIAVCSYQMSLSTVGHGKQYFSLH
jgi:hypothetical protein